MLPHVNGRRALARQLLKVDEDRPVAELLDLIIKQHRLEFGEGYFVTNANLVEKETVKFLPNQVHLSTAPVFVLFLSHSPLLP